MTITNQQRRAGLALLEAADLLDQRGTVKGWFCDPLAAEDLNEALTTMNESGIQPDDNLYTYEPPEDEFEAGRWRLIEPLADEQIPSKDTCRMCGVGAINYVMRGDAEDTSWDDLRDLPTNHSDPAVIADSVAGSMVMAFGQVLNLFDPRIAVRLTTAVISNYFDAHPVELSISAFRGAADVLLHE